jgi:hypothetical protein
LARLVCLVGIAWFFALPAQAEKATAGPTAAAPGTSAPIPAGTAEMKWKKPFGIPYPCQSGPQICVCKTGSDVIDCRNARPPVKNAD